MNELTDTTALIGRTIKRGDDELWMIRGFVPGTDGRYDMVVFSAPLDAKELVQNVSVDDVTAMLYPSDEHVNALTTFAGCVQAILTQYNNGRVTVDEAFGQITADFTNFAKVMQ